MNCQECGRFMFEQGTTKHGSRIIKWWACHCGGSKLEEIHSSEGKVKT